MGRVYAWKIQKINSADPYDWETSYAWLAPFGEKTFGIPTWEELQASKEYAKTLTTYEVYNAAFTRMYASIPYEYRCTAGL